MHIATETLGDLLALAGERDAAGAKVPLLLANATWTLSS